MWIAALIGLFSFWFVGLIWYITTDYAARKASNRWFIEFQKLSAENQDLKQIIQKYKNKHGIL